MVVNAFVDGMIRKGLGLRLFEKMRPEKAGLVELIGIEPTTSCMPCKRSPS